MARFYLNKREENYYLMIACLMLFAKGQYEGSTDNGLLEVFEEGKMLTPSSQKNFKTGMTYLGKFLKEVYEKLDSPTQQKIYKKTEKFLLKFIDNYEFEKFQRDINNRNKYAVIEREEFENLIEDIAEVRCKNCTRDYKTCNIYNALDESLKLEEGIKSNCKYSCDL